MTPNEKQVEKAAVTYGMFVACEAAEMFLDYVIGETCPTAEGLQREAKMYYLQMIDGLKKAKRGYSGFNERVQTLYSEMGATGEQMDKIRRDANNLVRMFLHARNAVESKDCSLDMDQHLEPLTNEEKRVISKETINKFVMR
jgi:hypothetical protein